FGSHRLDPLRARHLGGVGVGVDPDDVDPPGGEALVQMARPAADLADPLDWTERPQQVDLLQSARVPAVDDGITSFFVAHRCCSHVVDSRWGATAWSQRTGPSAVIATWVTEVFSGVASRLIVPVVSPERVPM